MASASGGRRAGLTALIAATVVVAAVALAWVMLNGRMPWPGADTGPEASATDAGIPARPADAFPMTVASVWDGDTLRAIVTEPNDLVASTDEVRIRLVGIDTPELGEECWADEARDALRALVPAGSTVWVAPDADPFDRYERLLLNLWTEDGRFVNHELVAIGAAETLTIAPNDEYAELLAGAQAAAEASGAGRWGACG